MFYQTLSDTVLTWHLVYRDSLKRVLMNKSQNSSCTFPTIGLIFEWLWGKSPEDEFPGNYRKWCILSSDCSLLWNLIPYTLKDLSFFGLVHSCLQRIFKWLQNSPICLDFRFEKAEYAGSIWLWSPNTILMFLFVLQFWKDRDLARSGADLCARDRESLCILLPWEYWDSLRRKGDLSLVINCHA